jgi:hypothetical protein
MTHRLHFPIRFGVILVVLVRSFPATASETEQALVAIRNELPFISLGAYLVNREPRDYSSEKRVQTAWTVLQGLHSSELPISELLELSEHPNADLRALAILAIVAKETPTLFPCASDSCATMHRRSRRRLWSLPGCLSETTF